MLAVGRRLLFVGVSSRAAATFASPSSRFQTRVFPRRLHGLRRGGGRARPRSKLATPCKALQRHEPSAPTAADTLTWVMRSSPWRGSRRAWRGRALMRVKGPVEEIALGKRSRRRRLHENRERFGKLSLARRSITVETRCFDNLDLYKCPWPSPGAHARLEVSIPPHEGTKDEAASEKICAGRSGEGMCRFQSQLRRLYSKEACIRRASGRSLWSPVRQSQVFGTQGVATTALAQRRGLVSQRRRAEMRLCPFA